MYGAECGGIAFNPSTQEEEAVRFLWVRTQPIPHSEVQPSKSSEMRPYYKKNKKQKTSLQLIICDGPLRIVGIHEFVKVKEKISISTWPWKNLRVIYL